MTEEEDQCVVSAYNYRGVGGEENQYSQPTYIILEEEDQDAPSTYKFDEEHEEH